MEVRADKFLSGHYAYFVELPERSLEKRIKELGFKNPAMNYSKQENNYMP